ncbi:unnamed protein product [Rotaria sp. Silwood2]|nr:unnamed protein product [Rotaria sp. Silwood2]
MNLFNILENIISSDDEYSSNLISQFEQTYELQQVVYWLTSNTPLIRIVNKALHEQDINMLFTLCFLLVDIYTQLIKHQADSLNAFSSIICFFNGFLFTSTNILQVMSNMKCNNQFEIVLIDLRAIYRSGVASFAFLRDINSNINKKIDQEVIFMCYSIFQIGSLVFKNSIWILELTLISDADVQELLAMKPQLKRSHNLCMIGDLLIYCEKSDKAMIYYQCLLNALPE